MEIFLELTTFIGGCLFYAFRGAVGKLLLTMLLKLGKIIFRFTEKEANLYKHQRAQQIKSRQLNKVRGR